MKTLDEILKQAGEQFDKEFSYNLYESKRKSEKITLLNELIKDFYEVQLQQAFSAGQEAKFSSTYKSSERYLTAWKLGREEMKKEIIKSLPETKQRVLDKKHGALREEYEHYKTGWNDCRGKMLNNLEKL